MDKNKNSMDTKHKLELILENLWQGEIDIAKAQQQILVLFDVVGRSEQLLAFARYLHNHSYVYKGFKPETLVRRFEGE